MRGLIAGLCGLMTSAALAAPVCVDANPASPSPRPLIAGSPGEAGGDGEGGIGGTGHVPPLSRGGIGGTGAPVSGDVSSEVKRLALKPGEAIGVVGVVTGFGSVCVNGMRLQMDESTPVSENGRQANASRLAVGQFVSIDARATENGLRASEVAIVHLMEGPVSERPGGGIAVMGQPVDLLPGARVADGLTPGTLVHVSGMRTPEGRIRASRIVRAHALQHASVIGDISRDGSGASLIEGVKLRGELPVLSGARSTGQWMLTGHWDGDALVAREVAADPTFHFTRHTEKVVLEALISGTPAEGNMTACGLSVRSTRSTLLHGASQDGRLDAARVRITGRVRAEGSLEALHIDADLPGQGVR
jgi:hypothetical protein